jgi:uncharacterized protein YciI
MPEYIYLTHPYREGIFDHPNREEAIILRKHNQYIDEAVKDGTVIFAGSCLDHTFGMVLLSEMAEKAARSFMLDDPTVKSNFVMAELHQFNLSFRLK